MEKPKPEESPSDSLVKTLVQYCHELEALRNSLTQVMFLLKLLMKKREEEREKFVNEHGKNIEDNGESRTFTFEVDRRSDWLKLVREINNLTAAQRLIPRNLLVAFVCTYDSFLGKLIRFIFDVKPEILDSSERLLKFSELAEFVDINAAREYLIEKEVETILRKSHVDHFRWLEAKLGTPFNKNLQSWPRFVELTERRNLFVHCDGVVSSQYLSMCSEHKCAIDASTKVGSMLGFQKNTLTRRSAVCTKLV